MVVYARDVPILTKGELDFQDITELVASVVVEAKVRTGTATVFVPGATCAIVLNENDPVAVEDFKAAIERLIPKKADYKHGENPQSHVRSLILGPSCTIPVRDDRLQLGTWQSVFLVELDIRPRKRKVSITIVGTSSVHEGD